MKIISLIDEIPPLPLPCGLSIGTFDGIHLGHQRLLSTLKALVPTTVVFTFSNHPFSILKPKECPPLIYPTAYKLQLLEELGIDLVILQPFTTALSQTPFDLFLEHIHQKLPFSYLVLGEGEAFGSNKQGNAEQVKLLGKRLGFEPHYVPKLILNGTVVSSGAIRALLADGKQAQATHLLGRSTF